MRRLAGCTLQLGKKNNKLLGLFLGPAKNHLTTRATRPYSHPLETGLSNVKEALERLSLLKYTGFGNADPEKESATKAREAIFSALRTQLLLPQTRSKHVIGLLRDHFLNSPAFKGSVLTSSEKGVLAEILHKALDEWADWSTARSSQYMSPARLMAIYAQHDLLAPNDWAFCLNSLASTAYEAFFVKSEEGLDERLQISSDTFPLLHELLRTWKLFFHRYSGNEIDVHGVLNDSPKGLWSLLDFDRPPAALLGTAVDYGQRLLAFAPKWTINSDSIADRQLVCASLMSIAALCRFITASTTVDVLLQDVFIDWKASTISQGMSMTVEEHRDTDSHGTRVESKPVRHRPQGPFRLQSDQISMLFILGSVVNSDTVNPTLLRVALARMIPPNRVGGIMIAFDRFVSCTPILLGRSKRGKVLPVIGAPISSLPMILLLQSIREADSTSELDAHLQTYLRLRKRNIRLRLSHIQEALCEKCWDLDCPEQERLVWHSSDNLRTNRKLWSARLKFYYRRDDQAGFEQVWDGINEIGQNVIEAEWRMRLQLYFNRDLWELALDRFKAFRFICDGARVMQYRPGEGVDGSRTSGPPLRVNTPVTPDIFNLMIRNLLNLGQLRDAMVIKTQLDDHPHIAANQTTYNLLVSFFLDSSQNETAADLWKHSPDGLSGTDIHFYFLLLRKSLNEWPLSTKWAHVTAILETYSSVLALKYPYGSGARSLRKTSRANNVFKVYPLTSTDTLKQAAARQVPDDLTKIVPLRSPGSTMESLCTDYTELMLAFAVDNTEPSNSRLMLILWTHCLLQGVTPTQKMETALNERLARLAFRQQLRLLAGDVYKKRHDNGADKYSNFAYVRDHFGPAFMVRRMEALGLHSVQEKVRKMKWLGFDCVNEQWLTDAGIEGQGTRRLILTDIEALNQDSLELRAERWTRRLTGVQKSRTQAQLLSEIPQEVIKAEGVGNGNGQSKQGMKLSFSAPSETELRFF